MRGYSVKFPTVSIEKKFLKNLKKISPQKLQNKIRDEIKKLADNPRPHGEPKIKPPIRVYDYIAQYRLRIGNCRVLYDVDDGTRTVWIFFLRKRNERTY